MAGKAHIAFLLNPVPAASTAVDYQSPVTVPMTPPAAMTSTTTSSHRDVRSPEPATLYTSSLLLLGSCITPLETTNKRMLPAKRAFTTAVMCAAKGEAASSCSSEDDEEDDEERVEADASVVSTADQTIAAATRGSSTARPRKARTPPCQVEGCKNIAVSRGCCVRHGGGSRCTVAGCKNRAKLYKRCFQHGGFKTCSAEGCTRKAKRYGHCWSHGGGRICEVPDCTKVSTQGGLCWAHGGGNRCRLEGCSRRSYQKYGYYCFDHSSLHYGEAER